MAKSRPRELVIVPGHAPFKKALSELPAELEHDAHWCLAPFQAGEPRFYLEHIRRGLELASARPAALLVFSGGVTREEGGWSEAETYRTIARSFLEPRSPLAARLEIEGTARDSWENLLLSVLRFHSVAGDYPQHVTVVGWSFKRARFDLHRESIQWPAARYDYVGVNDPPELAAAEHGEALTRAAFQRAPFGNHGPLAEKRALRTFGPAPPDAAPDAAPDGAPDAAPGAEYGALLRHFQDAANAAEPTPAPPWPDWLRE